MTFILALDQGTTSSRAIVFDDAGAVCAVAQREFKQYFPQPGWVEHDAEEIWTSQLDMAAEALAKLKLKPADIAAVGITNQRETAVLWNRRTGEPLHRAIVWQDRRTAAACDRLRADGREALLREKTGLVIDPYFSGTKIAWLLDHVSGARDAAEAGELACGTIDSWLAYQLTAGALHITDASNASRTQLMNIHTGQWDDELLACFNIPRGMLPEIRPSSQVYGEVAAGLPLAGAPLAALIGDQQGALFGQTCFAPGETKNTYGTGCFMLMNTGPQPVASQHRLLSTIAWRLEKPAAATEYALEGGVFIGGAAVGWLRDGLGVIKHSSEVEALANTVPDSGGLSFVPAFAGLGAPDWDPYARGAIIGITRGTTAGHLARAALDGVALQVADLLEGMHNDLGNELSELRVDGGASVNDTLLQIQADVLQIPVVRPKVTETTALGAAYLAGLAANVWPNRDAIKQQWQVDRRFEPGISADVAAARRATWRRAVDRTKGWAVE
jgi:glycerol kinase